MVEDMAFTIQDLIDQKVFPEMRLVAGRKGNHNEIFWINIMEILDSPRSLQIGELVFTTGYGLQQEELYKNLIPQLSQQGISGIAIQTGYYLDSIPTYILEQADQLGFPVLTLPKQITFSEILHTMTRIIDIESQHDWSLSAVKEASSFFEQSILDHEQVMFGDTGERCTYLLLFDPVNYVNSEKANWKKCLSQVSSLLQSYSCLFLSRKLSQYRHVLLASFESPEIFHSMLYTLSIKLTLLSEELGTNYYVGTEQLKSKDGFLLALKHAEDALNTLQIIKARRGVCAYSHISFIKMLGQIRQNNSSVVLDNQPLQLLLNYDRLNNCNYTYTLRVYLSNSCNITKTARQLFLHRHTLIKRLEKISTVANLDLDDYYTRLYMSVTMLFHDYFVY